MEDEALINFMKSHERAKKLINMDANGELDKFNTHKNNDVISENSISNKVSNTEMFRKKIPSNCNLPEEIIESFNDTPTFDYNEVKKEPVYNPKVKYTNENSTIDYNKIKLIVEECIKKSNLNNKNILNENRNELQAMKIGNKFSFITKNGDLYEAELKFIKNINKKSTI